LSANLQRPGTIAFNAAHVIITARSSGSIMRLPRPCPAGLVPAFLALFFAGALVERSLPAAEARAGAGSGGLPCEKYVLPNGMTVILHVDHALPTAGVNLWYRVGARNEPPRRSGFAHLFEHLMFMGTRRVPGSGFDDLMESAGGSNNASTSLDRTNYFSSGPSSLLPTLLWLDADRLEALGPTMTKEKLDLQRDVVRNEIRPQVENRPYGRAYERSYQMLYPAGHPYHNSVYGTHEDLEAAGVNDVKDFFSTFYTPDNCSLVVAGDFDPAKIRPLVAELFGTLPRGRPAPYPKVAPAKLDGVARATMLDKVQLPMVEFDYHSPAWFADGDAEMDLVSAILGDGHDGRLYRRLVMQDQVATSVSVSQDSAALGSVLRVQVFAKPDADLTRVEAAIDEELARISDAGPDEEEVRRRAATTELGIVRSLQDVRARADRLNTYEYVFGNPDSLERDLDRYRKATRHGVRDWAKRVLTPDARVVLRVLPEKPGASSASARDQRPADLPPAEFKAPRPTVVTLSNQVRVYVFPRHELPLAVCSVLVEPAGTLDAPARSGLGSLVAAMTQEGAGSRDSVAFAQAVSDLGASISAGSDADSLWLSLGVLSRNFSPGADLLADALLRPRMQPDDFNRVKAVRLDGLRQRAEVPQRVASILATRMLIDEKSGYAWPSDGTLATVRPITLDEVKSAHQGLLRDAGVTVFVAGDVTPEQAKAALEKSFGAWKARPSVAKSNDPVPLRPAGGATRVYLVDRPGAVQTVVPLEAPGVPFADPRRLDAELAGIVLGGSFTSRLNHNLREVHGYTYGVGSYLNAQRTYGTFGVGTSVKADVTGPALKEMLSELRRFGGADLTADEARKSRETFRTDTLDRFGTLDGTLRAALNLVSLGAPLDTTDKDLARAAAADASVLNNAAKQALDLGRAVLVLVGDKKLILEQIKGLGLPAPTELDAEGAPKN
jgi:predicted Zn-dependent peptidase